MNNKQNILEEIILLNGFRIKIYSNYIEKESVWDDLQSDFVIGDTYNDTIEKN